MAKSCKLPTKCIVIKGLRGREGLSQKQLAKKIKMSLSSLSRMETGKKEISTETKKKLAKALNTKPKMFN